MQAEAKSKTGIDVEALTMEIMSGMDCVAPSIFERHVRHVLEQTFYQPADPNLPTRPSKDDVMLVPLRVGDWMEIRDNLYLDADAESGGRAEAYCHENGLATERCAQVIDGVLEEHGWTELGTSIIAQMADAGK